MIQKLMYHDIGSWVEYTDKNPDGGAVVLKGRVKMYDNVQQIAYIVLEAGGEQSKSLHEDGVRWKVYPSVKASYANLTNITS